MSHIGIDFGTSNSSASLFLGGEVQRVPVSGRHECFQFPTVAYLAEDGRILTCHEAENEAELNPQRFLREFKLEIDDPSELPVSNGVRYEDVVVAILKTIKADAERFANKSLDEAVITIPAIYGMADRRREVMRRAAAKAGFKKVDLLLEPEAAGLYYAHRLRATPAALGNLTLVYDLGAGTFDPALIRRAESGWQLVPVSMPGVPCAGARFDELLREHFHRTVKPEVSNNDELARYQTDLMIERFCREAKHALSGQEVFRKLEPVTRRLRYEVTRVEFYEMIDPLLEETLACCERLLSRAQVSWKDLGQVLLVGGSCNIPRVRSKIEERICAAGGMGTRVCWSTVEGTYVSPDYAVSMGAALGQEHICQIEAAPASNSNAVRLHPEHGASHVQEVGGSLRDELAAHFSSPVPKTEGSEAVSRSSVSRSPCEEPNRYDHRSEPCVQIEHSLTLNEQMHAHFAGEMDARSKIIHEIDDALGSSDFGRADELTIRLIRDESGYRVFDSKAKADAIPSDVLQELARLWARKTPYTLRSRNWVQYAGDVCTYKGIFSLTTWLEQRLTGIGI
jgi:actin-like ATPase involved in cell morphogenesis